MGKSHFFEKTWANTKGQRQSVRAHAVCFACVGRGHKRVFFIRFDVFTLRQIGRIGCPVFEHLFDIVELIGM